LGQRETAPPYPAAMPDALTELDHWLTSHRRWRTKPLLLWQCVRYELERLGLSAEDAAVCALLEGHAVPAEPPKPRGVSSGLGAVARYPGIR
jgi:hypothetical protein